MKKNINCEGMSHRSDSCFSSDASYDFEKSLGHSSQNKEEKFLKDMFICKDDKNSIRSAKKETSAKFGIENALKQKSNNKILECFEQRRNQRFQIK